MVTDLFKKLNGKYGEITYMFLYGDVISDFS